MRNLKYPFSHDVFWGARKLVNLDLTCPVLYIVSNYLKTHYCDLNQAKTERYAKLRKGIKGRQMDN